MKTERAIAIIIAIGLSFKALHWPGGAFFLMVSLSCLSLLYFPGGFYFFSGKSIKDQNITFSVISGLLLSTVPIDILFKVMNWPGAKFYLIAGIGFSIINLTVTYILYLKKKDELPTYYNNMLIRASILSVISVGLIFF